MKFGVRLKQARQDKKLTQENVAQELNVSRQTISSWENERSYPDIDSLIRLSDFYHLSLDQLLKEDTGMKEEIQKKEQLAKINKVWLGSFLVNLLVLIIILLNLTGNTFFKMGLGVTIAMTVLIFANMIPLLYASREKQRLSGRTKREGKKVALIVLVVLIMVALMISLWGTHSLNRWQVYGIFVGMAAGVAAVYLLKKYMFK